MSALAICLNLVGIVIIGFSVVQSTAPAVPVWVVVLAFVSIAGWLAQVVMPRSWASARLTVALLTVVTGGIATAPTRGLCIVPVAVTMLQEFRTLRRPIWFGFGLTLLAMAILPLGALATGLMEPLRVLSMEAGVVVGALAGLSRRQFATARAQSRELMERTAAAREEHARARALADRQHVARDIHDVLAHSLGGLVIQLDAVEALLESGDTAAAISRVRQSRVLAAEGLTEARRAVSTLREPDGGVENSAGEPSGEQTVSGDEVVSDLTDLVAAERALGGTVEFLESGDRRQAPAIVATAMHRALQEALSNARKHAPGADVHARFDWDGERVHLVVENDVTDAVAQPVNAGPAGGSPPNAARDAGRATSAPDARAIADPAVSNPDEAVEADPASAANRSSARSRLVAAGGGRGLAGMRERFESLPFGGSATAGLAGDRFVVRAEARLS